MRMTAGDSRLERTEIGERKNSRQPEGRAGGRQGPVSWVVDKSSVGSAGPPATTNMPTAS